MRRPTAFPDRELPSIEPFWLPAYLVSAGLRPRASQEDSTPGTWVHCRVCALTGAGVRLDPTIVDLEPLPARGSELGLRPPFRLSAEQGRTAGRAFLGSLLLHAREAARYTIDEELSVEPVRHPYWLFLWERRHGRLDLRLLDALDGSRAGGAVRRAVIEELVAGRSAIS